MNFKRSLLTVIAAAVAMTFLNASVRDEIRATPEKAGGVYYAYPGPADTLAAAPAGYAPFYISHYGRHGSRYLISDDDYIRVIRRFESADSAGCLTALGKEVLRKLRNIWTEAEGRGGELTPLGGRQHKGIAKRMYTSWPAVFTDSAKITAASTQVMRCAHSMMAFCEGLKEENPRLEIPKESSARNMSYLCWWTPEAAEWNSDRGPWKSLYDNFERKGIRPERLYASLFTCPAATDRKEAYRTEADLMWGLYWIAVDMQNMETRENFFDLFTPDELFSVWEVNNLSFYIHNASFPMSGGLITANARNLLDNIVRTADEYIASGNNGATLRFGHDGNITPLAALMAFDGFCGEEADPAKVCEVWTNFRVTPMASNMQAVFFKPGNSSRGDSLSADDVLVKFMMNEHDVLLPIESGAAPFYRWADARRFFISRIERADSIISSARNSTAR